MSRDALEQFIVEYLSGELALEPEEIDVNTDFSSFGIDSVAAIGMIGALEEASGRFIDPSVWADHPTIRALSTFLARP